MASVVTWSPPGGWGSNRSTAQDALSGLGNRYDPQFANSANVLFAVVLPRSKSARWKLLERLIFFPFPFHFTTSPHWLWMQMCDICLLPCTHGDDRRPTGLPVLMGSLDCLGVLPAPRVCKNLCRFAHWAALCLPFLLLLLSLSSVRRRLSIRHKRDRASLPLCLYAHWEEGVRWQKQHLL